MCRHRDRGRDGRCEPERVQEAQPPRPGPGQCSGRRRRPDWNADTDFDVRLQDVPLTNHCPDVIVYRAETIDLTPTRPEHVLLVVEVVSPGSETTDRIVKVHQYAKAGIPFYWRVEQAATGVPITYTYVLDPATKAYRDGEMFTGAIKAAAPFSVTVDLGAV